jgi:2-succinyl-5-enolpyruvyl-6-hydroxy-3-cyclohexene-1-carboxylate synthase
MYGLDHYQPKDGQAFVDAYVEAIHREKSVVLEVQIDRKKNVAIHRDWITRMLEAVKTS